MERFRLRGEKFPVLNQRLFIIHPTFDAVGTFADSTACWPSRPRSAPFSKGRKGIIRRRAAWCSAEEAGLRRGGGQAHAEVLG